jgi:hypothetical protein
MGDYPHSKHVGALVKPQKHSKVLVALSWQAIGTKESVPARQRPQVFGRRSSPSGSVSCSIPEAIRCSKCANPLNVFFRFCFEQFCSKML